MNIFFCLFMSSHFTWEEKYKRTWEQTDTHQRHHITKAKQPNMNTKKALIRHLHISIDHSTNIDSTDFLPSIRELIDDALITFECKFKQENPLSTFSKSKTHNKFSLQKALDTVMTTRIREILILISSLTITDTNTDHLIKKLTKANIKVSVICFYGDVKIYRDLCKLTGGDYYVPLDSDHFLEILNNFLVPKVLINSVVKLLKIGFPTELFESYCACHLEYKWVTKCVLCGANICLGECTICECLNVDGMSLYKNLYYMSYLKQFEDGFGKCICGKDGNRKCECGTIYCNECDRFLHDYINFCIYCDN